MTSQKVSTCTSFAGSRMIASGNLFDVAVQTKLRLDAGEQQTILIFDDDTSNLVEIDFRGQLESFKRTLISKIGYNIDAGNNTGNETACQTRSETGSETGCETRSERGSETDIDTGVTANTAVDGTEGSARGRGRPKLGVVAREVTLLPRHWEWLNHQPGGASVALRKLVEEAKRANLYKDERRAAQDSTYKFMSAMAGNLVGFEEATRALFASSASRFYQLIEDWPPDIAAHVKKISEKALA